MNKRYQQGTSLLAQFIIEIGAYAFPLGISYQQITAVLVEVLTQAQCTTGASMGKLRKELSHWGWIVVEPARAIEMAASGGIGHGVGEFHAVEGKGNIGLL